LGCYTKAFFEKKLLEHYIWIKELGNHTRQLPPSLVDEELGMAKLEKVCLDNNRVVLLCAEKDENGCHRKYVKEKIIEILENHE